MTRCPLRARGVIGLLVAAVVGLLNLGNADPDRRAVVLMGLCLIAIWCVLGGTIMVLGRRILVRGASTFPLGWKVRFVLFAALVALIGEAVTTSLTNTAPLLGATNRAAHSTDSTNRLGVITTSVVLFIPCIL